MSTISSTISSAITPRDDGNEEDNHAAKKKRTKKLTETEKTLEEIQNFFEYHNTLNVQLASIVVKLRCFTQSINEILAFVRSLTTKVKNNELTDQYLFTFVANTFRYAVYLDALCGSVVDKPNQLISLPPWLISQEKVHGNYQTFQEYGKELSEKLNKKRNKTDEMKGYKKQIQKILDDETVGSMHFMNNEVSTGRERLKDFSNQISDIISKGHGFRCEVIFQSNPMDGKILADDEEGDTFNGMSRAKIEIGHESSSSHSSLGPRTRTCIELDKGTNPPTHDLFAILETDEIWKARHVDRDSGNHACSVNSNTEDESITEVRKRLNERGHVEEIADGDDDNNDDEADKDSESDNEETKKKNKEIADGFFRKQPPMKGRLKKTSSFFHDEAEDEDRTPPPSAKAAVSKKTKMATSSARTPPPSAKAAVSKKTKMATSSALSIAKLMGHAPSITTESLISSSMSSSNSSLSDPKARHQAHTTPSPTNSSTLPTPTAKKPRSSEKKKEKEVKTVALSKPLNEFWPKVCRVPLNEAALTASASPNYVPYPVRAVILSTTIADMPTQIAYETFCKLVFDDKATLETIADALMKEVKEIAKCDWQALKLKERNDRRILCMDGTLADFLRMHKPAEGEEYLEICNYLLDLYHTATEDLIENGPNEQATLARGLRDDQEGNDEEEAGASKLSQLQAAAAVISTQSSRKRSLQGEEEEEEEDGDEEAVNGKNNSSSPGKKGHTYAYHCNKVVGREIAKAASVIIHEMHRTLPNEVKAMLKHLLVEKKAVKQVVEQVVQGAEKSKPKKLVPKSGFQVNEMSTFQEIMVCLSSVPHVFGMVSPASIVRLGYLLEMVPISLKVNNDGIVSCVTDGQASFRVQSQFVKQKDSQELITAYKLIASVVMGFLTKADYMEIKCERKEARKAVLEEKKKAIEEANPNKRRKVEQQPSAAAEVTASTSISTSAASATTSTGSVRAAAGTSEFASAALGLHHFLEPAPFLKDGGTSDIGGTPVPIGSPTGSSVPNGSSAATTQGNVVSQGNNSNTSNKKSYYSLASMFPDPTQAVKHIVGVARDAIVDGNNLPRFWQDDLVDVIEDIRGEHEDVIITLKMRSVDHLNDLRVLLHSLLEEFAAGEIKEGLFLEKALGAIRKNFHVKYFKDYKPQQRLRDKTRGDGGCFTRCIMQMVARSKVFADGNGKLIPMANLNRLDVQDGDGSIETLLRILEQDYNNFDAVLFPRMIKERGESGARYARNYALPKVKALIDTLKDCIYKEDGKTKRTTPKKLPGVLVSHDDWLSPNVFDTGLFIRQTKAKFLYFHKASDYCYDANGKSTPSPSSAVASHGLLCGYTGDHIEDDQPNFVYTNHMGAGCPMDKILRILAADPVRNAMGFDGVNHFHGWELQSADEEVRRALLAYGHCGIQALEVLFRRDLSQHRLHKADPYMQGGVEVLTRSEGSTSSSVSTKPAISNMRSAGEDGLWLPSTTVSRVKELLNNASVPSDIKDKLLNLLQDLPTTTEVDGEGK